MTKQVQKTNRQSITFLCSIADNASAIKVTGNREGLQLTLDIPESDIDATIPLIALRSHPLRVTIEIDTQTPLYVPDQPTID